MMYRNEIQANCSPHSCPQSSNYISLNKRSACYSFINSYTSFICFRWYVAGPVFYIYLCRCLAGLPGSVPGLPVHCPIVKRTAVCSVIVMMRSARGRHWAGGWRAMCVSVSACACVSMKRLGAKGTQRRLVQEVYDSHPFLITAAFFSCSPTALPAYRRCTISRAETTLWISSTFPHFWIKLPDENVRGSRSAAERVRWAGALLCGTRSGVFAVACPSIHDVGSDSASLHFSHALLASCFIAVLFLAAIVGDAANYFRNLLHNTI